MQTDLHVTPKGLDGHQKRVTLLEEVEEMIFQEDEDWGGDTPIFVAYHYTSKNMLDSSIIENITITLHIVNMVICLRCIIKL